MTPINIKDFSKNKLSFSLPSFLDIQFQSWEKLWEEGIDEAFSEVFPIRDYSGKHYKLDYLGHELGEAKYENYLKAKTKDDSYVAPFQIKLRLTDLNTKKSKIETIFLVDFPVLTERGTFIINGVEKVLISQIIRSPGILFTAGKKGAQKNFGALVVPERGSWLEFTTSRKGVIKVKINRRRKITATTLLKALGGFDNKELKKMFKKVDSGSTSYIEKTLEKDPTTNDKEALVEIYRRLRPGKGATLEASEDFVKNMFFNFSRYDLGKVGRWKIGQRLENRETPDKITHDDRVLKTEDLVEAMKEIIRLNNDPKAEEDQVDHLGNRRVRSLNELLQTEVRRGVARIRKFAQDRMSTVNKENATPSHLVNPRPFASVIQKFFNTSSFAQFMDNDNPLSELEHKRRISATGPGGLTRERAGFEARDVQSSHYGRLCPLQTPEGKNVGLTTHLTTVARPGPYGFLQTPYFRVKNGKVTDEIVYLEAHEEEKYKITHAGVPIDEKGKIIPKTVEARYQEEPMEVDRKEIDFIDVTSTQTISVAASLIPFLKNDDAVRAMMGSNMQRQAVPLINPDVPLVLTGMEKKVARESHQVTIAEKSGKVKEIDGKKIKVGDQEYELCNFLQGNQYTCFHERPQVEKGQKIKKGQVLSDGSAIKNGRLSLGKNLLVAFMPFEGMNYEDAIVVSERVAKRDDLTSVHIEDFSVEVRDTKLGPEQTTSDIPNVSSDRLKDLDEEGIVRIGAKVGPNDILVGKISPKGKVELSAEERLVKAIFGEKAKEVKDTSLTMPHGKFGKVIGVQVFSREQGDHLNAGVIKKIKIQLAQLRKIEVGDKIAGRHGNKGVISHILPEEEMPFLEDGRPVDVILNPLGVISRMNLGQLLETHLGWAAGELGYHAVTPALGGASVEEIKDELEKAGLPRSGKTTLYDGKTGEKIPRPVTVGKMYIIKLHHMVKDKIHMRSTGTYSLITQQPLGGKAQFGGQRFGEMEVWALEGYGSAYTLQEMLTIKSDDVKGRAEAYESILKGEPIQDWYRPASFNLLINELKALGLEIELEY